MNLLWFNERMAVAKPELRKECIRLRVEERASLPEIQVQTGASKGSISQWLRKYPLTKEELKERRQRNFARTRAVRSDFGQQKKDRGVESELHRIVRGNELDGNQVGKVSETAVLLRLLAHGFVPFGSPFDGDRADWVVEVPDTGRILKIQVKTAQQATTGLPTLSIRRAHSKGKYEKGDFDIFVGFNLYTDIAYVWAWEEIEGRCSVSICEEARERWDKMKNKTGM